MKMAEHINNMLRFSDDVSIILSSILYIQWKIYGNLLKPLSRESTNN